MMMISSIENEGEFKYLERIYTHGSLEEKVGYDLTCCDETLYGRIKKFKEGDEETLVRFDKFKHEDEEYKVVLYIWKGRITNFTMGLVVDCKDTEAVQYANERMKARVDCL